MKNKTSTSLIVVALVTLCGLAGLFYMITYVEGLSEKTAEIKSDIEVKQIKIKHIQGINKSAEKTSEDGTKVMSYFIKSDGAIDFVSLVESTASTLSLKYNTNSIENISDDILSSQGKDILKISMTLSGGWKNILKFLLYVESLPYSVRVEKVELTSEGAPAPVASSAEGISSEQSISQPRESSWRLALSFSVVKIKERVGR